MIVECFGAIKHSRDHQRIRSECYSSPGLRLSLRCEDGLWAASMGFHAAREIRQIPLCHSRFSTLIQFEPPCFRST